MAHVYIESERLTPNYQLQEIFGSIRTIELSRVMISGLINDIDTSVFDKIIIGLTRGN